METNNNNNGTPVEQKPQPVPATPPVTAPVPPQYYAAPPSPRTPKAPVIFDKTDSLFAALAVAIGFLFFELILLGGLGFGVPAFFAAAYTGVLIYGIKSKSMDIKKGLPLGIPIVLLLLCFVLFDNPVLAVLNLFFLFFLATLQFMAMFGVRDHEKLSKGVLFDFFGGFVGRPVMNLDKLFVIAAKGTKGEDGRRVGFRILLGIVICVPLLAVILSLLASADFAFESVLKKIADFIGESVWEYFGKLMLGIAAAVPLFGAFYAYRYKKSKGSVQVPDIAGNLDRVVAYTILSVICAVYLFFLFVQFNYMFFAFGGRLPGGFIYSEYARRGFFELVAIAAINLGLLAAFYLFTAKKDGKISKVLKGFLLTLSVITIVIIASAISKMVMYMQIYGLTQLRVYTSWFMVLTAVIFLLAIVKIISRKFNAVRILCVFFTAWFLVLNYAGVDALIAKYNIAKSEQHKSVALDVNMFGSLSDSMVPAAAELLNSGDIAVRYRTKVLLTTRYNELQKENWQTKNLAGMKAEKLLESIKSDFYYAKEPVDKPMPETDKSMLLSHFPKLTEIEGCVWYWTPVFYGSGDEEDTFTSNGEVSYTLYGYAVLRQAYFDEIEEKYEWLEPDISKYDYNTNIYFEDLPSGKKYFDSAKFEDDQSVDGFPMFLLEKSERKLYFWYNPTY